MNERPAVRFDSGLDITLRPGELSFDYGPGVLGPAPEMRRLADIRLSLRDPQCDGPDPVYGIAMDVCRRGDEADLKRRYLLFGVVVYASGRLGDEPVRSQGHTHAPAPHSGWSTPELFEIWEGRAIVYAQESAGDDPGRCIAVEAGPGDQVVVPPGWAHSVINADEGAPMVFGAWCERQYRFLYDNVRAHGGLAWYPLFRGGRVEWQANPRYTKSPLRVGGPRHYPELGLDARLSIYRQYQRNPEAVQWISDPARLASLWATLEP
ncbi:MAG TPA: glucose-6-phosphate isomerase family protein [Acidobacteriaceae bacterium]|nr:glucose-6-phosphate isomerase family protein [Acidobacteriaceae bacterium]